MSVHVISWVLQHSEEVLAKRLVLLVLADHSRGDGSLAWPSVETIAHEARLSRRQAQRALRDLEASGAITPTGHTRQGVHIYTVNMGGRQFDAPGSDISDLEGATFPTKGGVRITPEPSLEATVLDKPEPSIRQRDEIWDALESHFGPVRTPYERGRRNAAVKELREANITPTEIKIAYEWCHKHFSRFTERAICSHVGRALHESKISPNVRQLFQRARVGKE